MQTRVINEENPKFQPITIQLTIENVDELKDLWHRMNIAYESVMSNSAPATVGKPAYSIAEQSSCKIWQLLDDLTYQNQLRK